MWLKLADSTVYVLVSLLDLRKSSYKIICIFQHINFVVYSISIVLFFSFSVHPALPVEEWNGPLPLPPESLINESCPTKRLYHSPTVLVLKP